MRKSLAPKAEPKKAGSANNDADDTPIPPISASKPNCLWVCNSCVNTEVFTNNSEDKLTSFIDSSTSKIKISVAELIPKAMDDSAESHN